ncbi:hypothetical protein HYALB_00004358 [Hymenoscyphus albidus]|uniref:Rhodopsin domain-containing protein n=1 Tax=Hymenoscyphus albidus TaxID=595503 RepID=A0A9N9LKG3_9HELO|nr:hypothetical protein HYALB_00004358 [Hymenoscyphus albidus]
MTFLYSQDMCGLFVSFTYCIYTLCRGVGFFVHQWDIRVKDTKDMLYYIHFSACFYAMSVMCLKVAILLEWTRIFSPHGISRRFSRICYTLLVINVCFYTASVIASALSCRPYKRIWDKLVPGTCINTMILDVTSSAINVLSNIIILLLPQHIIWRLQMTLKRKIGVALVFGVGIICVASALGRLVATVEYFQSPDVSYHVSAVGIWCLSEMTCLLIVCCCPTISKIFNEGQIFSRVFSSLQSLRGTRQSRNDASVELSNSKDNPTSLVNTYRKIEKARGLSEGREFIHSV